MSFPKRITAESTGLPPAGTLHAPAPYVLIFTNTPAGTWMRLIASIVRAVGSLMSMIRLCVRISNCSRRLLVDVRTTQHRVPFDSRRKRNRTVHFRTRTFRVLHDLLRRGVQPRGNRKPPCGYGFDFGALKRRLHLHQPPKPREHAAPSGRLSRINHQQNLSTPNPDTFLRPRHPNHPPIRILYRSVCPLFYLKNRSRSDIVGQASRFPWPQSRNRRACQNTVPKEPPRRRDAPLPQRSRVQHHHRVQIIQITKSTCPRAARGNESHPDAPIGLATAMSCASPRPFPMPYDSDARSRSMNSNPSPHNPTSPSQGGSERQQFLPRPSAADRSPPQATPARRGSEPAQASASDSTAFAQRNSARGRSTPPEPSRRHASQAFRAASTASASRLRIQQNTAKMLQRNRLFSRADPSVARRASSAAMQCHSSARSTRRPNP